MRKLPVIIDHYTNIYKVINFDFWNFKDDDEFYNKSVTFFNSDFDNDNKLLLRFELESIIDKRINICNELILIKDKKKYARADLEKLKYLKLNLKFSSDINQKKKYITLHEITFKKDKLNIFGNDIQCNGSLDIYNELKDELIYHLGNNIFKFYISNNNVIDISKSNDLRYISNFFIKIQSPNNNISIIRNLNSKDVIVKTTKKIQLNILKKELFDSKNIYLKYLFKKLNKNDCVYTISEQNSLRLENSFLFIYTKENRKIIIWENENENRASHFFIVNNKSFNNFFDCLSELISLYIHNKRSSLNSNSELIEEYFNGILFFHKRIFHSNLENFNNSYLKLINTRIK